MTATAASARRPMSPATAVALSILGNMLVIAIVALAVVLVIVAGVVVFGPALLALV